MNDSAQMNHRGNNSPPDQTPDALNFLVDSPTFNDVPDAANFLWPNGIGSMPVTTAGNINTPAATAQPRAPAPASANTFSNQFSLDDAIIQQQQNASNSNNNNNTSFMPMNNYSLPQHLSKFADTAGSTAGFPSVVSTADSSYASSAKGSKRASGRSSSIPSMKARPKSGVLVKDPIFVPEEKRRYDRNLREQQRSYKISLQIKNLRNVLQESNIPFKPNKYSILLSVVEYIKELQTRAVYLDQEHQKLLNTISQTNDLVNNNDGVDLNSADVATIGNDSELLFVKGLDYKAIFQQCSSALCIAALDGRMLECNTLFEEVSGYGRGELLNQTVFNLLSSPGMEDLFGELSKFLKRDEPSKQAQQQKQQSNDKGQRATTDDDINSIAMNSEESDDDLKAFWSGQVHRKRKQDKISTNEDEHKSDADDDLFMNITLAKSKDGRPQFLNCALTAK